ncbi:MAG: hypothetical protein ABEJ56_05685 [Candidatus Nanohaloarchaea archaeon]
MRWICQRHENEVIVKSDEKIDPNCPKCGAKMQVEEVATLSVTVNGPYIDEKGAVQIGDGYDEILLSDIESVLEWLQNKTDEDSEFEKSSLVEELEDKLEYGIAASKISLADVGQPVKCEECSKQFYKCSVCGRGFDTDHGLRVHKGTQDHWKSEDAMKSDLEDMHKSSGDSQ